MREKRLRLLRLIGKKGVRREKLKKTTWGHRGKIWIDEKTIPYYNIASEVKK